MPHGYTTWLHFLDIQYSSATPFGFTTGYIPDQIPLAALAILFIFMGTVAI
jgi:hypothetical protein